MNRKSVALGIIIILIVILATGCGFYNLLKPEDFKKEFSDAGFTISENEESEYESDSYLVARKSEVPYEILYYSFKNEVEAKKVYEKYKKNIVKYITTDSQNKETTGAVFSKVVAISDKEYIIISRVKETLIFVAGTNEYAKQIDTLLEDIKY